MADKEEMDSIGGPGAQTQALNVAGKSLIPVLHPAQSSNDLSEEKGCGSGC